ncbi:MAG: hypothetical protein ACRDJ3_07560 [Solirubrobacteraceae bacterium]
MRRKLAGILAGSITVLALTLGSTTGASAASWHVAGSELLTTASLASTTETVSTITLTAVGTQTITCSGKVELLTAVISHPAGGTIGHLVLNGCSGQGACSLIEGSKIETKPLKIEAALGSKNPEDTLLLKPQTGTTFAEIKFPGEECVFFGTQKLTGQARFIMPHGQEELASQTIELHAGTAELRMGSFEMLLGGSIKAKLTSGSAWSFR